MIKLIALTPLSSFFFGSETTFGQGENRHYYVRSRLFPQQTSLLGMLRYELLKSEPGFFDESLGKVLDTVEAQELIGKSGFSHLQDKPYGIIDFLSPIFLLSPAGFPYFRHARQLLNNAQSTRIIASGAAEKIQKVQNLLQPASQDTAWLLMASTNKEGLVNTEPYEGKVDFQELLVGTDGSSHRLNYDPEIATDGVFILEAHTGNRKNYDGASDDSGFYKQDRYRLRPGWRFAFLADFNKNLPEGFGEQRTVQLGAERGQFRLEFEKFDNWTVQPSINNKGFDNFEALYGGPPISADGLSQMVLLSDAFLERSNTKSWAPAFEISTSVSFRHLETHLKDPNALWSTTFAPKSSRFNLLEHGSVFFAPKVDGLVKAVEQVPAFRRIGYNYCKMFEKDQI